VIVETENHDEQMADLSVERIAEVFKVYTERIRALEKDSTYVIVFKNHGGEAGTSLVHSHTQIASLNIMPTEINNEVNAVKRHTGCPYCGIIETERNSDRRAYENDTMIAFAPYASRFNYEIWVFPKEHIKSITDFDDKLYQDLADIMKKILLKLETIGASYNFILHYAPEGEDLHFHIEVLPRVATWGGFEFNSGIIINSVSPETAAEFYRS